MKTPSTSLDEGWLEQFERFGPSYRWLLTIAGLCGTIAMVLPSTIVNMVIPSAGWFGDSIPNHYPIIFGIILFSMAMLFMSGLDATTTFWSIAALAIMSRSALDYLGRVIHAQAFTKGFHDAL